MLAFTALPLFSFVLLATAIPNNTPTVTITVTATAPGPTVTEPVNVCSTGSIQCCQSTQTAGSGLGSALLGLLGIVLDPNVLLGLDCSPITVVGVGSGNACSANVVCCENNNVGGLISIGCAPVIL